MELRFAALLAMALVPLLEQQATGIEPRCIYALPPSASSSDSRY
jgi:hypothetical protein